MTLPAPVHVYQLDGSAWGPSACMGAAGAMALDAYTGGAIRVGQAAIRANQDDQSGGIGLDDVATAWRRGWGLTFTHGPAAWSTIAARLDRGDGVVITANYGALRSWRAPGSSFTGAHALYLAGRTPARAGQAASITVHDPLRRAATSIPESAVKLAYTGGAGWGKGTYAGKVTASSSDDAKRAQAIALLKKAGVPSSPDSHVFTRPEAEKIAALYPNTPPMLLPALIDEWTGKTVADWIAGSVATGYSMELDPLAGVAKSLADLPANLQRSGVLLGVVVLALLGVWLTFREPLQVVVPASVRRLR